MSAIIDRGRSHNEILLPYTKVMGMDHTVLEQGMFVLICSTLMLRRGKCHVEGTNNSHTPEADFKAHKIATAEVFNPLWEL